MAKPLISHIGIAVADLDRALDQYKLLTGDSSPEVCEVPDQQVTVAIFDGADGRIELVAPTSDDSPVARFIEKRGEGLHHICIYVDDIRAKLTELKQAGVKLIDESPRTGAGGHLIAFVHPSGANGVLIELTQRTKE